MTSYKLARFTTTGSQMTVTTTNPAEVERWLWDAMSAQDTKSVTIAREYVDPPRPKAKPECEGQTQLGAFFNRETGVLERPTRQEGMFEVYDHEHGSWVLSGAKVMARKLTDEEYESAVQARSIGMAKSPTRPITRIPLTIVTTGTNHEMKGILVGVMAGDLDRLEEENEVMRNFLAAFDPLAPSITIEQFREKYGILIGGQMKGAEGDD